MIRSSTMRCCVFGLAVMDCVMGQKDVEDSIRGMIEKVCLLLHPFAICVLSVILDCPFADTLPDGPICR